MRSIGLLALAAAVGCALGLGPGDGPKLPGSDGRPHHPWVFRSVLDGNARMLTAALHDDLWVAYDTQTGGLYKAWRGGVKFDGAVYTTRHGPQPTSQGEAYASGDVGGTTPWRMWVDDPQRPGERTIATPEIRFLGHAFQDGHVSLRYELVAPDGRIADVFETPEAEVSPDGQVKLVRRFGAGGEAADDVVLLVPTGFLAREGASLRVGDRLLRGGTADAAEEGAFRVELSGARPVVVEMNFGATAKEGA